MTFTSITFILFFFFVLILYYCFRSQQKIILLFSSILFYCFAGPKYIIYIFLSTLTTYFCAYFISDIYKALDNSSGLSPADQKQQQEHAKRKALRILRLDFLIVLGILVVLKYFNFFCAIVKFIFFMVYVEAIFFY